MLIYARLIILVLTIMCSAAYAVSRKRGANTIAGLIMNLFALYALAWILFMAFLWFNHINFPLNLEAMELTVLQHLKRVMAGQPIYVKPSPDFVPLAYAPLYYYLTAPFAWIFGANLFTLRLVAILGMMGSEIILFLTIKKYTHSFWWSIIAVGLFAAAYRVMDTYLDNAHSDSWLLFTVLLGCYLIDLNHTHTTNLLGVFFLILSFWFKQHGALFAIGGVLYLTLRDGWKNSWLYWALAGILGPGLYIAMPSQVFGPQFHYYTFTVPRRWSEFNFDAMKRYLAFIIKSYPLLAIVGVVAPFYIWIKKLSKISIWFFMLPFAMLSGFMGALDPGSNNNVFILMGFWFIVSGILGLYIFTEQSKVVHDWGIFLGVIGLAYTVFLYNPMSVIASPKAPAAYNDMISYLKSLDGPVYAPWVGQLENRYAFSPALHWVPLEDIIRGPGVNEFNHPNTRKLLDQVINPKGNAYILMNYPLENDSLLNFLLADYQLEADLGDRFAPLTTLPKRFNLEYPRYLYKHK